MYEPGDYVKVEFRDERSGQSEWMWVKVDRVDPQQRIAFGRLDNEPVVNTDLKWGMELAVSYDVIRDHVKPSSFSQ